MSSLLHILNAHGIVGWSEYQAARNAGFNSLSGVGVVKSSDIHLDPQGKMYGKNIAVSNKIIDCDSVIVPEAVDVNFFNVLMCGDLHFTGSCLKNVLIDQCVIVGELTFLCDGANVNVECYRSNLKGLRVSSSLIESLYVHRANVVSFSMDMSTVNRLRVVGCQVSGLSVVESNVIESSFDHRWLSVSGLGKAREKFKICDIETMDSLFSYFDYDSFDDKHYRNNVMFQTFQFALGKTTASSDKNVIAKIKKAAVVDAQRSMAMRFLMEVVGGFVIPSRLINSSVGVVLVFALMYWLSGLTFSVGGEGGQRLGFFDALYFSGVTFLTIGYGDITPENWGRVAVLVEGFLGVSFVSGFVVSLVKKYVESAKA